MSGAGSAMSPRDVEPVAAAAGRLGMGERRVGGLGDGCHVGRAERHGADRTAPGALLEERRRLGQAPRARELQGLRHPGVLVHAGSFPWLAAAATTACQAASTLAVRTANERCRTGDQPSCASLSGAFARRRRRRRVSAPTNASYTSSSAWRWRALSRGSAWMAARTPASSSSCSSSSWMPACSYSASAESRDCARSRRAPSPRAPAGRARSATCTGWRCRPCPRTGASTSRSTRAGAG